MAKYTLEKSNSIPPLACPDFITCIPSSPYTGFFPLWMNVAIVAKAFISNFSSSKKICLVKKEVFISFVNITLEKSIISTRFPMLTNFEIPSFNSRFSLLKLALTNELILLTSLISIGLNKGVEIPFTPFICRIVSSSASSSSEDAFFSLPVFK